MTTNTKFFDTKEQYLAFRAAFAKAVNDPRAKKTFNPPIEYTVDAKGKQVRVPVGGREKISGWVQGHHYVFLNLVRGLPYHYGFSPKTKRIALANGYPPNQALFGALWNLHWVVKAAKSIQSAEPVVLATWQTIGKTAERIEEMKLEKAASQLKYEQNKVTPFLEVFGGTITIDDLVKLDVPTIELIMPQYYPAFIEEIADKRLSWAELTEVYNKHTKKT